MTTKATMFTSITPMTPLEPGLTSLTSSTSKPKVLHPSGERPPLPEELQRAESSPFTAEPSPIPAMGSRASSDTAAT